MAKVPKGSNVDKGSVDSVYLVVFLVVSVFVVGSLAVVFFSQGSIIGDPGTSKPCEWTVTQTEDGEKFTSFDDLNSTLNNTIGEDWRSFYNGTEVRKNPSTGYIEDRLEGSCSGTGSIDSGDSK